MAVEKWATNPGWTSNMTTELNSLASGNAIASGAAIDNSSLLDLFMDVSIALGSFTPVAPNFLGIYVYPLNQDGSTYGDGRFGSAAAGPPGANYYGGFISLVKAAQAQKGVCNRIIVPPGSFKIVVYNGAGATLAGSANTLYYRMYDRAIA